MSNPPTARRQLMSEPAFRRYFIARLVSWVGSEMSLVALPLLIYRASGSAFLVGVVGGLEGFCYLLFGLLAGAIADRVDRRRLMVGCDLLCFAALAAVPVLALAGHLTVGIVLAAAAVAAGAYVWFDAGAWGAIIAVAGRTRLTDANALMWSVGTALGIAAPAAAGVLLVVVSPTALIAVDALSYLVAGLLLWSIRVPLGGGTAPIPRTGICAPAARPAPTPAQARIRDDIREGLAFLWGHDQVRLLTLLGIGNALSGGTILGLLAVYGARSLGLGTDGGAIGLLWTAVSAGALIGAISLPRLVRWVGAGAVSVFALSATALLTFGIVVAPNLAVAMPVVAAWQVATSLVIMNGITIRQQVTPEGLQSRVGATGRTIAWGAAPLGSFAGGAIADATSVRWAIAVLGVGVLASAVAAWCSPLRQVRETPGPPLSTG